MFWPMACSYTRSNRRNQTHSRGTAMTYEAPKIEAKSNVNAEFGSLFRSSSSGSKSFRINGS